MTRAPGFGCPGSKTNWQALLNISALYSKYTRISWIIFSKFSKMSNFFPFFWKNQRPKNESWPNFCDTFSNPEDLISAAWDLNQHFFVRFEPGQAKAGPLVIIFKNGENRSHWPLDIKSYQQSNTLAGTVIFWKFDFPTTLPYILLLPFFTIITRAPGFGCPGSKTNWQALLNISALYSK